VDTVSPSSNNWDFIPELMDSEPVGDVIYSESYDSISGSQNTTDLRNQSSAASLPLSDKQRVSTEERSGKVSPLVITLVDICPADPALVNLDAATESTVSSNTFDSYLSMFTESLEGFDLSSMEEHHSAMTESDALPCEDIPSLINTAQYTQVLSVVDPGNGANSLPEHSRLISASFYCCYSCLAVNYVLNAEEDSGQLLCFSCGQLLAWEKCENCSTIVQIVPGCHKDITHPQRECARIIVGEVLNFLLEDAINKSNTRKEGRQIVNQLLHELTESAVELKHSQDLFSVKSILNDLIFSLPDKETELFRKYKLVPISITIQRMKREDVAFFSKSVETFDDSKRRLRKRSAKASCVCCPHDIHHREGVSDEDSGLDEDYDPDPEIRYRNRTSGTAKRIRSRRQLYYCNFCGDAFRGQSLLERHIEKRHGFACQYCDIVTASLEDFRDECFNN